MARVYRSVMFLVLTLLVPVRTVQAQSPLMVQYPPGWDMAGAPPGTDLSAAQALFTYGPGGYTTPGDSRAMLCQGYWFATGAPNHWLVPLSGRPPASDQTCSLQAGWNMVGNPFFTAALLPAGTLAYTWTEGRYEAVDAIPLGGAVWINAASAGSIVLHAAPNVAPSATGSIPPGVPTPTYHLHVGQTIQLTGAAGSGGFPDVLAADAHYLALQASSVSGGTATWTYRAMAPGRTSVGVTLSCYYLVPACLAPSTGFTVEIVP